jgi:Gpi18-like mannosyltransferase
VHSDLTQRTLSANSTAPTIHPENRTDLKTAADRVLGSFLITRLSIFLIGYLSSLVILKEQWYFTDHVNRFLDLFFCWDSRWYLSIVTHGYQFNPGKESNVAFFPLYPLLVKALSPIINAKLAGYIISNVALFFGTTYFYRLILLDHDDEEIASKAVFYVLVSPASLFFSIFYTEGLFLFLVVTSFYYARRRAWLIASLLGLCASLTKALGVLLVIPLLIEYFDISSGHLKLQISKIKLDILYLLLVPMGLFLYMAYLYLAFGDAFAYSHASSVWHRKFVPLTVTLRNVAHYALFYRYIFMGSVIIGAALLCLIIYQRTRISYVAYCGTFMFMYLSSNLLDSIPRYISVLFPLYIGLALLAQRNVIWHNTIIVFSMIFLTLFTILFVNGYWLI